MDKMKLKICRIKKELNQYELAELVGCSQQSICSYESGRVVPNADMLKKLADALGVHPGEFF